MSDRPVQNRPVYQMMNACLNHAPPADLEKDARELAPVISGLHDPEARYINAGYFAFCGQKDIAVRLIKGAIAEHYCAYTDLQNSLIFATLRGSPEFTQLLSAAKQCRDDFLAERSQTAH